MGKSPALAVLLAVVCLAGVAVGLLTQPGPADEPKAADDDGSPAPAVLAPTSTDRYGDPLPPGALARLGSVRLRHGGTVTAVRFTPDGSAVVSGGWDGRANLWDATTGKLRRTFGPPPGRKGRIGWVESLALSPDGKILAVGRGNGDPVVRLYDVATGRERACLQAGGIVAGVAFLGNGKTVVGSSSDGTVRFWDVATGKEERRIATGQGWLRSLAVSADGRLLATSGDDHTTRIWDSASGTERRKLPAFVQSANALAFSPDGRTLASGGHDRAPRLWDVKTGQERRRVDARQVRMGAVALSPDGTLLASGGQDRLIRLWDPATGKELKTFGGHNHSIDALAFSRDGKRIVTGSWDHTVRVWDVATGKELTAARGHENEITALAFAPDGKTLVTAADDSTLRFWEPATGREVRRQEFAQYVDIQEGKKTVRWRDFSPVRALAYSPDGKLLITGGQTLQAWDTHTGKPLRTFSGLDGYAGALAVSANGKVLAAVGNKLVSLWDLATGKELGKLAGHADFVRGLAVSPDGKTVATGSQDRTGKVKLWDIATGRVVREIQAQNDTVLSLAFSADGRTLAGGGGSSRVLREENDVQLWDVATGQVLRQFHGEFGAAVCVAFSPDGWSLAAAGGEGVWVWETATGGLRRQFQGGHKMRITALAFAPEGRALATAGADTTAVVWDLAGPARPEKLTAADLATLWNDLAAGDAARAFRAVRRLRAAGGQAVGLFQDHLRPPPAADTAQVTDWIRDLDSERFAVRQRAMEELGRRVELAEPALRRALAGKHSLEVRQRLEHLLDRLNNPSPDALCELRAIEVLEGQATPEARALLERLAGGPAESRMTRAAKAALGRLARRVP